MAVAISVGAAPPHRIMEGGSARPSPAGCNLKIVCWNIERGQQQAAVSAAIKKETPTIALLQEVDLDAKRTGYRNVAEDLAGQLGMNYLFAPEFEELGQGRRGKPAYHGQAILTGVATSSARFIRFRDQSSYWQPRWFVPNWAVFQRREGGRLALVVELGTAPNRMVVYNVHLESRGAPDLRLRQIEEIIADTRHYPGETPLLIAGDLNTREPSPPAVKALLDAGFRKAVGGEVTTVHGTRLDWIFVRGPITFAEGAIHANVRASDHFPLTVRVRLEPPACR
ncbi:MAG TPA: endonuclease/exonuclease/phosphatase family protein [Bryobacteraceae bacterium]|nr:endonuclease/exonuclease/phosphatase family protein [Bryobacteraceae bacterium]